MNAVVELLKADVTLTYLQVAEKLGLGFESVKWSAAKARAAGELAVRPKRRGSEWPAEHIETLKALWTDGKTASEITEILIRKGWGTTRNAVLGKVHRLDLETRGSKPTRKTSVVNRAAVNARARELYHRRMGAKPSHSPRQIRISRTYREPPAPPEMLMVGLLDLQPSSCRFPIGDPRFPGFAYCGVKHDDLGSYCAFHRHLAYQPPESQSRRNRDTNYVVRRYA